MGVLKPLGYLEEAKRMADHLERIHKKLYNRLEGYKPKSKLGGKNKKKIPGFSYRFRE